MTLPLLLAGPILRRVEPTLVSVWLALRDPATVTLSLWRDRIAAGSGNVFLSSEPPGTRTLRVGKQLHIVYDEEIPREGIHVSRHYQMARWIVGSTWTWMAHRRRVGRGEGSSGLRFDAVEAPGATAADVRG